MARLFKRLLTNSFTLALVCGLVSNVALAQSETCIYQVRRDGMSGFIDRQGKLLFPLMPYTMRSPRGDLISVCDSSSTNLGKVADRLNPDFLSGNSGLLNMKGEWILKPEKQSIGYWGNGSYWVCKGGRIRKYCTEPEHVEGGKYALVNFRGILADSLDDIAVTLDNGFSLLYRDRKIAVMDSSGKMRSGFEFDLAVHWAGSTQKYSDTLEYGRPWKIALQQSGKWYSLKADGKLEELPWPTELGIEWRTDGWCKRPQPWIESYHLPFVYYEGSNRQQRPQYLIPQNVRFEANFPSEEILAEHRQQLVDQDLAELGLKIIERDGLHGLAKITGEQIIDYGYFRFEATQGGLIKQMQVAETAEAQKEAEEEGFFQKTGLLNAQGKVIVPMEYYIELRVFPMIGLIEGATFFQEIQVFDVTGKKIAGNSRLSIGRITDDGYCMYGKENRCTIKDWQHNCLLRINSRIDDIQIVDGWLWYRIQGSYFAKQLKGKGRIGPIQSDSLPLSEHKLRLSHPEFACEKCDLRPLKNGNWLVINDTLWGMCDANGEMLLPLEFDYIYDRGELLDIDKGGLQGIADSRGKILIPAEYELAFLGACDLFTLAKLVKGKLSIGVQDRAGNWIWDLAEQ
jgi:hypothetical protein